MKKIVLFVLTFVLMTLPSMGQGVRVPIKPSDNHSGHKSPENYSYLPAVIYDDETETLSFEANADLGLVPYTVADENDNVVLSGYIYIYVGNTPTVSVSSLLPGDYSLTIEVGGTEFEGEFTI